MQRRCAGAYVVLLRTLDHTVWNSNIQSDE